MRQMAYANTNNDPVLVLDLDGTLVDSKEDLTAALNAAIGGAGLSPISAVDVGSAAGKGARAMISLAYELNSRPLEEAELANLFTRFLDYYNTNTAHYSRPYAGALEALDRFTERGWLLAVCTNKTEHLARKLLAELEIDQRFDAICGSDTFDFRKPDGRHIIQTISQAGGNLQGSIMVGDTPTDINAAIDAGIPSIAVDFGYHDGPVHILGADHIISHFDDLWSAVVSIGNRAD